MITRVHINRHVMAANKKNGTREPPITVKRGGKNVRASRVTFTGPAQLVWQPDRPLKCGATIWIETEAQVVID